MVTIRQILQNVFLIFFLNPKQDEKKPSVMMAISRWSVTIIGHYSRKFAKINFHFFSVRQVRRKKAQCYGGNFAMVTIRENLQKLISTFFKRELWRKEVQFHDGSFAMVTIRETLQNLISTVFSPLSMTKGSGVSWWQYRDGHHSRNFAKINFDCF